MSEINISLLRRIVEPLLASNPELQGHVTPLVEAADSDGVANEEDDVLTEEEVRTFLERTRREVRSGHSILTRRRSELVGSLSDAQRRLEDENASPTLLAFLEAAAEQDGDTENLCEEEIELLVQTYAAQVQHLGETEEDLEAGVTTFLQDARELLRIARTMRQELPEAFFPENEGARRQTIDLNFLKDLPLPVFLREDDQGRMLQELVGVAGIDLQDREADWSLSFEELQQAVNQVPMEAESDPEVLMANLRFTARVLREQINAQLASAIAEGEAEEGSGVDLRPLLARRNQLAENPMVDLLAEVAGEDGILTRMEAEAHVQRAREENPSIELSSPVFLAGARRLVEELAQASDEDLQEIASEPALTRDEILNQRVLDDLERMREGFTNRDRDYVENDSIFAAANAGIHFFTLVGTLGIYHLAGGPSYRDAMREAVDMHHRERGEALGSLRMLLEHPDRDFREWLATRPEERGINVPNALEYMRSYEERYQRRLHRLLSTSTDESRARGILFAQGLDGPSHYNRHHELLTSPLFQADRLWRIHSQTDRDRMEQAWYDLANELREGYWVTGTWATHLDHIDNLDFPRAILHGLRRQSPSPEMRSQSRIAYQDSTGMDITDDSGNVLHEGGGELGLWPPDWFRNFSDENVDGAASDVALVILTWRAGGLLFRGITRAMSTAGRYALQRGILAFLGWNLLRGAGSVGTRAATESAVTAPGWFSRVLAGWANRRAAQAFDHLASLEATGGSRAEIAAAREAWERAARVHSILSSPTGVTAGRAAAAALENASWSEAVANTVTRRLGGWSRRLAERWMLFQNTRIGSAVATSIWLTGQSLRLTGRALKYVSYEGIVTLGIAGYLFENAPRHSNHPLIHDREYDLHLPEEEPAPEGERPVAPLPEGERPSESPEESAAARLARGIVAEGE